MHLGKQKAKIIGREFALQTREKLDTCKVPSPLVTDLALSQYLEIMVVSI